MRKMIIAISLSFFAVIALVYGIILLAQYKTSFPAPHDRSNATLTAAITRTKPTLATTDGHPIFTITSKKRVASGFYFVSLHQKNAKNSLVVNVIVQDPHFDANDMGVIAGPESSFSRQDLVQADISTAVIDRIIFAQGKQ